MDPSVFEAIRASVEANPENLALRLHYASLLATASRFGEALEQATLVLGRQPDNLEALKIAADAADATGDKIRAHGYRKLHEALSWNSAKNLIGESEIAPPPPTQAPVSPPSPQALRDGYSEPDDEPGQWETERPEIKLADVAGMETVKRRLQTSFLGPMRNPDLRKLYGKSLRGGLLLYGPPGCGKTFMARAIAGELGAGFLSVGLTDVVDMWLGQSEKNLHELFQTARRTRPCVLFMDELDALGRKRSLMRHQAGTGLINQLLAELDGVEFDNEGVFFLAATNHPWDVDAALRRPGRLDRMLLVLPPDLVARESIVQKCTKERPVDRLDTRWIAEKTEDFSGADVAHLCDSAAEFALEDSISSGTVRPINMGDFKQALKEVRPSTRSWLETAKNHAIYANEGGIYDDLLAYLKQRRML
ncbi:AAA family ATPase [Fimbriimonas ginsengisoli]|nr:AAA family ATPase [Fimbriimonas ginsengisoli]